MTTKGIVTRAMDDESLIQRAKAKATGANIHDVILLGAYYRNASEMREALKRNPSPSWPPARVKKLEEDIERYAWALERVASTGIIPILTENR